MNDIDNDDNDVKIYEFPHQYCDHRVDLTMAGPCPHCARELSWAETARRGVNPNTGLPFVRGSDTRRPARRIQIEDMWFEA